MTAVFQPAFAAPHSSRLPGLTVAPVSAEGGVLDFAALLTGRAMLDTPVSAGDIPTDFGSRHGYYAPAAVRFDQGTLFGHAFPFERSPALGLPGVGTAFAAHRVHHEHADAQLVPAQGERAQVNVSVARDVQAAAFAGSLTEKAAAACPHSAVGDRAPGFGPPSEVSEPVDHAWLTGGTMLEAGRRVPGTIDPAFGPVQRTAEAGTTPMDIPVNGRRGARVSLDRVFQKQAGESRLIQSRARYVEELAPVQVVVREIGSGVELVARVGIAAAGAAHVVERRLREVVMEEGHLLTRLRLNGVVVLDSAEKVDG